MKLKKFKLFGLWVMLAAYLIVISGFVSAHRNALLCNKVNINIADSLSKKFLNKSDIYDLLSKGNSLSLGESISSIDTKEIEDLVLSNSLVKNCEVYITVDGKLNIDISQREPLIRIIDKKGQNYYLDVEGSVISMSKRYTPLLPVANGNIHTPFGMNSAENIFDSKYKDTAKGLKEIYAIAKYIYSDEFWNSQVVQIYVDKKGEYEIIPRIGPHVIQLGKAEDFEKKFEKLLVFYNEGLKNVGWNKYLYINLKYKDQIVCTKI